MAKSYTKHEKKPDDSPYKYEKEKLADSKKIRGVFHDAEVKGGTLKFPFRKYNEPITWYELTDGYEYELPLAVVKHLNSNCFYMEDAYSKDLITPNGMPIKNPNPKKHYRFAFKAMEYS